MSEEDRGPDRSLDNIGDDQHTDLIGLLRRRWDEGKASGISGELCAATLIAEEKAKRRGF
ncbi:hypothetical protein [Rhodoplanes azumiensis]|uniref:Uncharacterized protein n=1 Tax=Rhodoplanes azumiensis TaxID=1897628 RepID=A0ABW5ANE9_9BRAD